MAEPTAIERRFEEAKRVDFPCREFLYTLDQMAVILGVETVSSIRPYVFCQGGDSGAPRRGEMVARNIALPGERPDWRVTERDFVSWLRRRGIRVYSRRP